MIHPSAFGNALTGGREMSLEQKLEVGNPEATVFTASLHAGTDGNFYITGSTRSLNGDVTGLNGGWDMWLLKLSPSQNLIWQIFPSIYADNRIISIFRVIHFISIRIMEWR